MSWQWKPNQNKHVVHYHYQIRRHYYRARSRYPALMVVAYCLGILVVLGAIVTLL